MGLLKNIFIVPVVMACAAVGTIGMVMGIGKSFCKESSK